MQTEESDWITVNRDGCSSFRYENRCQRGYFPCDADCVNCHLGNLEQIEKFGKVMNEFKNIAPNFLNLKFFTKSNINNHSFFEHRSSR